MNLDDETLLSAYLDDELDPADRLAVEWSIESNPPLAEQYRSLAQARDAVSGLSRPAIPRDLTPALGARIATNRRRERLQKLARPAGLAVAFSGLVGVAASLIFALILLNHSLHESSQPVEIVIQPQQNIRPHSPEPLIQSADAPQNLQNIPPVVVPQVALNDPAIKPGRLDETREQDARAAIAGMLEQPHIRRIRIVTDVLDASKKVEDLINLDARKNPEFGRISICQEIVIDPECPEAVEVFAVPMDERDRRAFVGQLAQSFPNLVEDHEETSPDLVTQLTEVGQIALFTGTKAAPLVDPPHDLRPFIANKSETPKIHIVEAGSRSLEPTRSPESAEDRKVDSPKPVVTTATDLKPSDRVTVLVWVVTRPHRGL